MAASLNIKIRSAVLHNIRRFKLNHPSNIQYVRNASYYLKQQMRKNFEKLNIGSDVKFANLQPFKSPKMIGNDVTVSGREDVDKIKHIVKMPNQSSFQTRDFQYSQPVADINPFPQPIVYNDNCSCGLKEKILNRRPIHKAAPRITAIHASRYTLRYYSTKPPSKPAHCTDKREPCKPKKNKCKKHNRCPTFMLRNCPCRDRFVCDYVYRGVKCKKQNAPYPAYSEYCAVDYPDDPSECAQCPWSKCPVKFNSTKKFHTMCCRQDEITIPLTMPDKIVQNLYHTEIPISTEPTNPLAAELPLDNYTELHSDNLLLSPLRKPPCQAPPPICPQKHKIKDEGPPKRKKERCLPDHGRTKKPSKKAANNWTEAYQLGMPYYLRQDIVNPKLEDDVFYADGRFPFDEKEASYEHKRKRPPSGRERCKERVKRQKVKDCPPDPCKNPKSLVQAIMQEVMEMKKQCPDKITRVPVDRSMDNLIENASTMSLCEKKKKKKKKKKKSERPCKEKPHSRVPKCPMNRKDRGPAKIRKQKYKNPKLWGHII